MGLQEEGLEEEGLVSVVLGTGLKGGKWSVNNTDQSIMYDTSTHMTVKKKLYKKG